MGVLGEGERGGWSSKEARVLEFVFGMIRGVVVGLFVLLFQIYFLGKLRDKMVRMPTGNKKFSIHSWYKTLCRPNGVDSFPWKNIWKSKVPSKVAFFGWSTSLGKILTLDNLRKHGLIVLNWGFLCKKFGESVDHLLLHCDVTRLLWYKVFNRCDLA
ncbi:uncharacterized protein LOC122312575 [Carya illinoinensis]|uniref:uncharacterized protein LOC122312575 n=1 Tax=Carya illinoinensis TaxID=32201 RepID=UPI001C719914|nr:uncharacterized protein LOC122312575 [Carya illinoinensis]